MPTFWFGGRWLSGKLLQNNLVANDFLTYYLLGLPFTFVTIAFFPLLKIVIQVGRDVGRDTAAK